MSLQSPGVVLRDEGNTALGDSEARNGLRAGVQIKHQEALVRGKNVKGNTPVVKVSLTPVHFLFRNGPLAGCTASAGLL